MRFLALSKKNLIYQLIPIVGIAVYGIMTVLSDEEFKLTHILLGLVTYYLIALSPRIATKLSPNHFEVVEKSDQVIYTNTEFIRSKEPNIKSFQKLQDFLFYVGLPPLVDLSPGSSGRERGWDNSLSKLKPRIGQIRKQLYLDGGLQELPAGNITITPLYTCIHQSLGIGCISILDNKLGISFLDNISDSHISNTKPEW